MSTIYPDPAEYKSWQEWASSFVGIIKRNEMVNDDSTIPEQISGLQQQVYQTSHMVNDVITDLGNGMIERVYKDEMIIQNDIGSVRAEVNETKTLMISQTVALADLIQEITATVGDVSAQALFRAHASVTPGAALAEIDLQVRVNEASTFQAAGLSLIATATGSKIALAADQVEVDGTLLINGAIVTNYLASGAATTEKIGTGAATQHLSGVDVGPHTVAPTNYATLISQAITTHGNPVEITGAMGFANKDNTTHGVYFRLVRQLGTATTQIWPTATDATLGNLNHITLRQDDVYFVPIVWAESLASGVYTYKLQWKRLDSANVVNFNNVLSLNEIKR